MGEAMVQAPEGGGAGGGLDAAGGSAFTPQRRLGARPVPPTPIAARVPLQIVVAGLVRPLPRSIRHPRERPSCMLGRPCPCPPAATQDRDFSDLTDDAFPDAADSRSAARGPSGLLQTLAPASSAFIEAVVGPAGCAVAPAAPARRTPAPCSPGAM